MISYAVGILGIIFLTVNHGEPIFMAPVFLGMIGLPSVLKRDETKPEPDVVEELEAAVTPKPKKPPVKKTAPRKAATKK